MTSGVIAVFDLRGWRPIAFPPFAVPFLLLTSDSVLAACAATLVGLYVGAGFYLYRLARLCSSDPLVAASASAFVISMPAVARYFVLFFSESAWLFCSIACIYHLLRSGPFKLPKHAIASGLFGGLMLALRPVESAIILVLVSAFIVTLEIRQRRLAVRTCLFSVAESTWAPRTRSGLPMAESMSLFLTAMVRFRSRLSLSPMSDGRN